MTETFTDYGFPYPEDLILTFIGGSQLHGAKLDGKDDTDWYGVYIEPPEKVLGLDEFPHFVFTTGGLPGGNQPHDVDVCLYSLRKVAGLLAKGNPSVLHFLFAKPELSTQVWEQFASPSQPFLAKSHLESFLGFADSQLRRLLNQRAKDVNRPALESRYGYDTKFAMHMIRLYGEAKELMQEERISLPRPNSDELVAIRHGKYTLSEIQQLAEQLKSEAEAARQTSSLPESIDRAEISRRLTVAYQLHWKTAQITDIPALRQDP
jgi:predicted nucleotidyltransferase